MKTKLNTPRPNYPVTKECLSFAISEWLDIPLSTINYVLYGDNCPVGAVFRFQVSKTLMPLSRDTVRAHVLEAFNKRGSGKAVIENDFGHRIGDGGRHPIIDAFCSNGGMEEGTWMAYDSI